MVGYLGRLAPEKNLEFVTRAVAEFLKKKTDAHFLVCGTGPSLEGMQQILTEAGVEERFHPVGAVKGKDLIDAYHAMNVFVFASQSETQGLVLTEAMAAGVPILAVDAPGAREVVKDGTNGRLLPVPDMEQFASALGWFGRMPAEEVKTMKDECRKTAESFAMPGIVKRVNDIYISLIVEGFIRRPNDDNPWTKTGRLITAEWEIIKNLTKATGAMMISPNEDRTQTPGGGELAFV